MFIIFGNNCLIIDISTYLWSTLDKILNVICIVLGFSITKPYLKRNLEMKDLDPLPLYVVLLCLAIKFNLQPHPGFSLRLIGSAMFGAIFDLVTRVGLP